MVEELATRSRRIPPKLRKQVWEFYSLNPKNTTNPCFVCQDKINVWDFECGHVQSHAEGGPISLENLRPICGSCNKSMGSTNLFEYKKTFYSGSKKVKENLVETPKKVKESLEKPCRKIKPTLRDEFDPDEWVDLKSDVKKEVVQPKKARDTAKTEFPIPTKFPLQAKKIPSSPKTANSHVHTESKKVSTEKISESHTDLLFGALTFLLGKLDVRSGLEPTCHHVLVKGPNKGRHCTLTAITGSKYCKSHAKKH